MPEGIKNRGEAPKETVVAENRLNELLDDALTDFITDDELAGLPTASKFIETVGGILNT